MARGQVSRASDQIESLREACSQRGRRHGFDPRGGASRPSGRPSTARHSCSTACRFESSTRKLGSMDRARAVNRASASEAAAVSADALASGS